MRRIETHSSWLLLGGERVLKLKKPVRSPFLDFTTVQARGRKACAELFVNRLHAARGSDVHTTIVGGEVVVEGGRLTRVDETAVLAAMRDSAAALLEASR